MRFLGLELRWNPHSPENVNFKNHRINTFHPGLSRQFYTCREYWIRKFLILVLALIFSFLYNAKKCCYSDIFLFCELVFLLNYWHFFSLWPLNLKISTSGGIFEYYLIDFVPCSGNLIDHYCKKLLFVLPYLDIQTPISSALFASFFHQGVNRGPFLSIENLLSEEDIFCFLKSRNSFPSLERECWLDKCGKMCY